MEEKRKTDGVLHKCHEGQSVVVEVGEEGDHKKTVQEIFPAIIALRKIRKISDAFRL